VTQFKPGDVVLGSCRAASAEYACTSESSWVGNPNLVTFERAASALVAVFSAFADLRDRESLFVPFYTTKQCRSRIDGSLSRQIIAAHRGTVVLRTRAERTSYEMEVKLPKCLVEIPQLGKPRLWPDSSTRASLEYFEPCSFSQRGRRGEKRKQLKTKTVFEPAIAFESRFFSCEQYCTDKFSRTRDIAHSVA
jgi:hypothetical protein